MNAPENFLFLPLNRATAMLHNLRAIAELPPRRQPKTKTLGNGKVNTLRWNAKVGGFQFAALADRGWHFRNPDWTQSPIAPEQAHQMVRQCLDAFNGLAAKIMADTTIYPTLKKAGLADWKIRAARAAIRIATPLVGVRSQAWDDARPERAEQVQHIRSGMLAELARRPERLAAFAAAVDELDRAAMEAALAIGGASAGQEMAKTNQTVLAAAHYIDQHRGAAGDKVADGIGRNHEHFRRSISPKLKKLGYSNDRKTGWRSPSTSAM